MSYKDIIIKTFDGSKSEVLHDVLIKYEALSNKNNERILIDEKVNKAFIHISNVTKCIKKYIKLLNIYNEKWVIEKFSYELNGIISVYNGEKVFCPNCKRYIVKSSFRTVICEDCLKMVDIDEMLGGARE